jgi:prepilin-type N-terminal cleavage/methylation domain-containing protein
MNRNPEKTMPTPRSASGAPVSNPVPYLDLERRCSNATGTAGGASAVERFTMGRNPVRGNSTYLSAGLINTPIDGGVRMSSMDGTVSTVSLRLDSDYTPINGGVNEISGYKQATPSGVWDTDSSNRSAHPAWPTMSVMGSVSNRRSAPKNRRGSFAFTLIELLVVIAIIGTLAALVFPVGAAMKKVRTRARVRAELAQAQIAIENYKTKLGYYPPDNPAGSEADPVDAAKNMLYYELLGTKMVGTAYQMLDGTPVTVPFGFQGFLNCTGNGGGGDNSAAAVPFVNNIKPAQYLLTTAPAFVLGTPAEGPNMLTDASGKKINPWCYKSTNPVHNRGTFDLWVDVTLGSDTYRFSNWSTTPTKVP